MIDNNGRGALAVQNDCVNFDLCHTFLVFYWVPEGLITQVSVVTVRFS